ncbi:trafficking protein particle complex subunit 6b-like [Schistocerca gregaria]|uniref:trafficking protein particle complex subunit 6b-like n=1 Tax=Schistocerca gregaria TaxID=7010 RepID=UPI00211DD55F|nr:trafficking protein particle complex subunit 6b-like [Schistocerca gregaria]
MMNVREVNASCLEFLLGEMVNVVSSTRGSSDGDATDASKTLEGIGFTVGHKLMERLCQGTGKLRFEEKPSSLEYCKDLEIVKFICKDFWYFVWKRQVEALKTSNSTIPRVRYILIDTAFVWLKRFSSYSFAETKQLAEKYLCFSAGIIRGAFSNQGIRAKVEVSIIQPELDKTNNKPQTGPSKALGCTFKVSVVPLESGIPCSSSDIVNNKLINMDLN